MRTPANERKIRTFTYCFYILNGESLERRIEMLFVALIRDR